MLILGLFRNRESFRVYPPLVLQEAIKVGYDSLMLVVIVSTFIGAVTAIQTAYNLVSPTIPAYIIGTVVRDMTVLELAPTITSIVLAGKVGSNIAGELGTMRISDQIDALEVMGINSSSYLVLPKILGALLTFPMLVVLSGFLSLVGGYWAGTLSGQLTSEEYIYGIRYMFEPFTVTFALIKAFVFAYLVSSISSYKGFFTRGGSLEVGQASTQAVTNSSIAILCADYLLANLLL